ncbi:MAG TPA: hypothetical protein VGZ47_07830, partial [Gemmataceae bacterium]|nr:hypothetical protein [Gemmataceae bacterium]
MNRTIEAWRKCWRDGFAPVLSMAGLIALKDALQSQDPALIQGATTTPPPLNCCNDWPCEGACAIGLACWRGHHDAETVGDVAERFALTCQLADKRLGSPGACRYFLNWFDDTPREDMRRLLLPEVVLAIAIRSIVLIFEEPKHGKL